MENLTINTEKLYEKKKKIWYRKQEIIEKIYILWSQHLALLTHSCLPWCLMGGAGDITAVIVTPFHSDSPQQSS